MSKHGPQTIEERLEWTKGKEGAMWPAALGYTEAAMYCRWHREDVGDLLERVEELERSNERLRNTLETIANAYKWPADGGLEKLARVVGGIDAHRRLPTVVRLANDALQEAARITEK